MRRFHDNDQGAIARRQSPQKCKGLGAKRHFTSAPLPEYQDLKSTKFKGKYFTTYTQVSKAAPTDRALRIAVILEVLGQTGVTCIDLYRKHHSLPRNSIKIMISSQGAFGFLCPFVLMWVTSILHLGFPVFTKSSLPILSSTAVQRLAVTAGLVVWRLVTKPSAVCKIFY